MQNLEEARDEIAGFYHNFHSYRYVGDICVIRVFREIPRDELMRMNEEFKDILTDPLGFEMTSALSQEMNEPEIAHLPRLCFHFDRHSFGRLRQVINRVNQY